MGDCGAFFALLLIKFINYDFTVLTYNFMIKLKLPELALFVTKMQYIYLLYTLFVYTWLYYMYCTFFILYYTN